MNYAKVFILMFVILFLPSSSLLALENNLSGGVGHIYISGQYKPSIPQFNKFSMEEATIGAVIPKSLKQDAEDITLSILALSTNFTLPYDPKYKKSLLGLGGTIGYAINNFRIELETFYEKFNVSAPSGYDDNIYAYFSIEVPQLRSLPYHYTMKNTGIILSPVLANICYDINKKQLRNVSPYLCLGFGVDLIDFLDKVSFKFSYQAKLGVSYLISPNLAFFIDGSFHRHLGNQFSDLLLDYPSYYRSLTSLSDNDPNRILPFTSASAKLNINFFSANIGIRFIF
uniref:Omp-1-3 n=1 Tax=Ehrlichia ewingii TaxID=947 RepID=B1N6A6_9RICK|nr:Omp-1-3 [Ehrlichia ewingii]